MKWPPLEANYESRKRPLTPDNTSLTMVNLPRLTEAGTSTLGELCCLIEAKDDRLIMLGSIYRYHHA